LSSTPGKSHYRITLQQFMPDEDAKPQKTKPLPSSLDTSLLMQLKLQRMSA
jgi:hypothetical protein